jgi:hypothetical protein
VTPPEVRRVNMAERLEKLATRYRYHEDAADLLRELLLAGIKGEELADAEREEAGR